MKWIKNKWSTFKAWCIAKWVAIKAWFSGVRF